MTGAGSKTASLGEREVRELCRSAFAEIDVEDKRLLFILPDHTRTAPIDLMFRTLYELLADRAEKLDFLIALGTHPPMSDEAICRRVGITPPELSSRYARARFFNHHWDDPEQLISLGTLSAAEVEQISEGRMNREVEITINKMVLDYDRLFMVGPVFPHEVVGFSGGSKYLFPGIAGAEIIDMLHWLGALITNVRIIGTKQTPVRRVVDRAADMVPVPRTAVCMVVRDDELAGLYIGEPGQAWSAAADLSDKLHVVYKERPYGQVLSRAPEMYDDLWTGGKCMYKLEPVVADGGELIIYAPHISEVSVTHGAVLERIGYHVRDYFLSQMSRFADVPGGIMAHSTHVKGIGTYENGVEKPRINVVLATRITAEVCARINLGYRDPSTIRIEQWADREQEGILYVPKAGETLFRLRDDPFRTQQGG